MTPKAIFKSEWSIGTNYVTAECEELHFTMMKGFVSMKIQRKVVWLRCTKFLPKIIVSAEHGSRVKTFVTFFIEPTSTKKGKRDIWRTRNIRSVFLEQQASNISIVHCWWVYLLNPTTYYLICVSFKFEIKSFSTTTESENLNFKEKQTSQNYIHKWGFFNIEFLR